MSVDLKMPNEKDSSDRAAKHFFHLLFLVTGSKMV